MPYSSDNLGSVLLTGAYAVEAMSWANAEGFITGTTATTLKPQGSATRAQVATILTRYAQKADET